VLELEKHIGSAITSIEESKRMLGDKEAVTAAVAEKAESLRRRKTLMEKIAKAQSKVSIIRHCFLDMPFTLSSTPTLPQVTALDERIRITRGLHLGQPSDLASDEVSLIYTHPDGLQTEVSRPPI